VTLDKECKTSPIPDFVGRLTNTPYGSVLFEYLLPPRQKIDCRPPGGCGFLLEQP